MAVDGMVSHVHHDSWGVFKTCQNLVLLKAFAIALLGALVGMALKALERVNGYEDIRKDWTISPTLVSGLQSVLGFCLVFRTAQAYSRYMSACTLMQQMQGCFFDAASSVMAFVKMSKANSKEVDEFRVTAMCLFSALHAFAFRRLVLSAKGKLEEADSGPAQDILSGIDVLYAAGLSDDTATAILDSANHVALMFHWIQSFLVENLNSGMLNIPPPILSRAFNEMADGYTKFEDCLKLVLFPFPSPYTQTTFILLCAHAFLTPFVICDFTENPIMVFIFVFIFLFTFWALYLVAGDLECPFDGNGLDMDLHAVQKHMNARLSLLITPNAKHKPALRQWNGDLMSNLPESLSVVTLIPGPASDSSDSEETLHKRASSSAYLRSGTLL
jgi:predicted membrane chloride channel (bestrophin family)